jgi:hypothetical protein
LERIDFLAPTGVNGLFQTLHTSPRVVEVGEGFPAQRDLAHVLLSCLLALG